MNGSMERQARLESMKGVVPGMSRNQGHNSFVFRRHQDFSRECDRKVHMFARETRYLVSRIERFQKEVIEKQRELESVDGPPARNGPIASSNKHHVDICPPKLHKDKKDVLLFRVRHRAGEKHYIREYEKFPPVPVHFNPSLKSHDKVDQNKTK